jgi:L-ascorbate metabolism protein UlaG (beta-lactamase superfamily)
VTYRLLPSEAFGDAGTPSLTWLGQAGFLLRLHTAGGGVCTVLVDPYLSDSLAKKYAGTEFPHRRLMPVPVSVDRLPDVDLVLCSHRHSDHMDPQTLTAIATAHPACRFVVPEAWRAHAIDIGLPAERVTGADADVVLEPLPGLTVMPVLAAHEALEFDELGHSRHLGYVIAAGGLRLHHSGDCVPYEGQADRLAALGIDVALLPINGRDAYRLQRGVPGNFHPREAVALAAAMRADVLVGHHFGMFEFNTVNEEDLTEALRRLPESIQWVRPEVGRPYVLRET